MATMVPVLSMLSSSARRSNQQPLLLAGDKTLHYRMERGEAAAGHPMSTKFGRTVSRYLAAAGSIALLVAVLVIRCLDLDPHLRDPYAMMILVVFCLVPGFFFFAFDDEDE